MGAVTLAAHEITRQIFIFSIQLFSALDVTAQSLVASQLGAVRAACSGTPSCSTLRHASKGHVLSGKICACIPALQVFCCC